MATATGIPFGEYFLLDKIASGGMAEIHRAEIRGLGGFKREVAIKRILPEHTSDERFVEMLLDEARIAARLAHPNIAQVIQCGCVDGSYFIVMELVDGVALSKVLGFLARQKERLSPGAAVFAGAGLLRALDHAHKAKDDAGKPLEIVHRDVSPHNVLVSVHGELKLVDFGVAHATDRLHKSETGVLKGKLTYMAPEQVETKTLDARTDQYSAGLVVVEMLTGKRVFGGQSEIDVIKAVLDGRTDDIGQQLKDANVAEPIASACLKAVAKDPAARFVDCESFANALLAALPVDVEAAKLELAAAVARVRSEPPKSMLEADTEAPTKHMTPSKPGTLTEKETETVIVAPQPAPVVKRPRPRWALPAVGAAMLAAAALAVSAHDPNPSTRVGEEAPSSPSTNAPASAPNAATTATASATVPTTSATVPTTSATVPTTSATPATTSATVPTTSATVPTTSATVPTTSATVPTTSATSATVPTTSSTGPTTSATGPTSATARPKSATGATKANAPAGVKGAIEVACLPWCDISIDGQGGLRSPLRNHELSIGLHVVEVVNPPSGKSDKKTVEIRAGETAKIGFRLE